EGKPKVVEATGDLALAAAVERASEHPLAAAIVRAAEERGLAISKATDVEVLPGRGIAGLVDGRKVEILRSSRSGVDIVVDGQPSGHLEVADAIKASTPE